MTAATARISRSRGVRSLSRPTARRFSARGLHLGWVCLALSCSDPLTLGNDVVWSADQETGDLTQWTVDGSGATSLPKDSSIEVSTEAAHRGAHAIKLVNPAAGDNQEEGKEGPELFHDAGALDDAYYSAWFLLPEDYHLEPRLTLMRLRWRDADGIAHANGEELQLRSLPVGGYVLQIYNDNAGFLLEPLADPAPRIEAGRWFQLEARYEPQSSGRLRVWLDGVLFYDLDGRPGAAGPEMVLDICNVAEKAEPAPVVLFVDDAAVSLSRVSVSGEL
jgi:hypothetical protein